MPDELGPIRIVRPDDLLNVTVELTNLRVSADRHFLERIDPAAPAWLTFVLPPQHLSEQAFMEYKNHVELAAQPPVGYVAAGPSRPVFALPGDAEQWPLDVASLLAWDRLTPRLAGNALPPDATTGPALVAPASDETALEVPYRLLLSPDSRARWWHRTEPFKAGERYEVWHSVLRPDGTPRGRARGAGPSPSVPSGSGTSATRSRPRCRRRTSVTWSPCPGTSGTTPSLQPNWALPFGSTR
jgi:hypothetical protein